ncbi:hypothetical protein [Nocardia sp. NPDC005825]|uniref:hypothetical protein n=1 Tax=unclassified Nocardia TaxID=2637762 RepID=UPI00340A3F0F
MGIDITCPTCSRHDQVQSVPAVQASGTSIVRGIDVHSGIGVSSAGLIPVIGSAAVERVESTRLAQYLAPAPSRRTAGKLVVLGILLIVPALFYLLFSFIALGEPEATSSLPWFIGANTGFILALATPSILLFVTASRRTRRNHQIVRGLPFAQSVWRAGHYCHRCGSCFWPYQPAPGVPVGHPVSLNQFQGIVWNAGGYANV